MTTNTHEEIRTSGKINLIDVNDAGYEILDAVKALYLTVSNVREDAAGSIIEGRIAAYASILDALTDKVQDAAKRVLEAVGERVEDE